MISGDTLGPQFSSTGSTLHCVGGVMCQPFLTICNHWKQALITYFSADRFTLRMKGSHDEEVSMSKSRAVMSFQH